MKPVMLALVGALVAGCDYPVPLVTRPTLPMDEKVAGLWQRAIPDGKIEALLVLSLDKETSIVSFPAGIKDSMFAKASLCRAGDRRLVQLQWFGTARGDKPDNNQVFQFADYTVAGDTLSVRLLNRDVVKNDVKTTDDLVKAIQANAANTTLFREPMVFKKAKPAK